MERNARFLAWRLEPPASYECLVDEEGDSAIEALDGGGVDGIGFRANARHRLPDWIGHVDVLIANQLVHVLAASAVALSRLGTSALSLSTSLGDRTRPRHLFRSERERYGSRRRGPDWSVLPHHRAYGSAHGGFLYDRHAAYLPDRLVRHWALNQSLLIAW